MKSLPVLLIFFIHFGSSSLGGQSNSFFRNFSIHDGLPSNYVNAIAEDIEGNIWIGTNSGLCRFDGQKMELIQNDAEGNSILSGNYISALEWVDDHLLAVGTYENGLNILNIKTLENQVFKFNSTDFQSIADDRIMFLKRDHLNQLWIGLHQKGIQIYKHNKQIFVPLNLSFESGAINLNNQSYHDLLWCRKDSNHFFLAGGPGIFKVEKTSGRAEIVGPDRKIHNETAWSAVSLTYGPGDILFAGLWGGGVLSFSLTSGDWNQFLPDPERPLDGGRNIARSIGRKNDKTWWVATHDQGMMIMDNTGQFESVEKSSLRPGGIPKTLFWKVFEDSKGDYWFAGKNGLSYFKKQNQNFSFHALKEPKEPRWRRLFTVLQVLPNDETTLYLGSWVGEGLYFYDSQHNIESIYPLYPTKEKVVTINGLVRDSRGVIYIGTLNDGLHSFNPKTKRTDKLELLLEKNLRIRALAIDNNDNLTISCSNNGIILLDLKLELTIPMVPKIGYRLSAGELITNLSVNKKGQIAAGGNRGIVILESAGDGIKKLKKETGYPTDFRTITSVHYDYDGSLWVGTENKGVFMLDSNFRILENYGESEGLAHNYINHITSDMYGLIFITHSSGLNILNPITNDIFFFNHSNGLFNESPILTVINPSSDLVYIGSEKGFFMANRSELIQKTSCEKGKVVISPTPGVSKKTRDSSKTFFFKPSQNTIGFYFNDYSFRAPSQISYRFRLLGWNEDYSYTSPSQYSVNYEFLPAGKYTFQVQSKCVDGQYYEINKPVTFVILKHFYQTTWFYTAALLLLIGVPVILVRANQKQKREKLIFEKRLSELKMESLRAQMNPHFIFNSLNSIRYYIQSQNHHAATKYLNKFSYLIRLILDYSRSQTISLDQELEFIKLYLELEQSRFDQRFQVHFFIDKNVDIHCIEIPPMLTQPFVENAIWHGLLHKENAGNLWYEVKKGDHGIIISIKDDGVGRAFFIKNKSGSHNKQKSHGMEITSERIEEFNKIYPHFIELEILDLVEGSKPQNGTEVRIKIKLGP